MRLATIIKVAAIKAAAYIDRVFDYFAGWESECAERRDRKRLQDLVNFPKAQHLPVGFPKYKGFTVHLLPDGWAATRYPKSGRPVFIWANSLTDIKRNISVYWQGLEDLLVVRHAMDMDSACEAVEHLVSKGGERAFVNNVVLKRPSKHEYPPECIHGQQGPCSACQEQRYWE